ncbi:MAG: site-specific DNA-methyltransferase, partial [Verrucomicrobiota bacterium]|nr:site-specific DNA-methyltransferase [Verrucomicrobiota bacterium]
MPRKKRIEQYEHKDKTRVNNPQVGLVDAAVDPPEKKKSYAYDPHLDPQLQWAGKAERTSFEVPSVSLHVHERIDPRTIIEAVRRKNGNGAQMSLFSAREMNPPLREAIEFYKHRHNWTNRLIAGDSLLVMNSLIEKEALAGQVQMFYFDPPYGIKYGSNFQPFVNKRDVKDGKDEDLTSEPEMLRAFRDTWELGIHSYLTYLRDRLLLMRELLHETGSIFVQISDENVHRVRQIMDEVFGVENFCREIKFFKTTSQTSKLVPQTMDYLLWYARDKKRVQFRTSFAEKDLLAAMEVGYDWIEEPDGTRRPLKPQDKSKIGDLLTKGYRVCALDNLISQSGGPTTQFEYEFQGQKFRPASGGWKTNLEGMKNLEDAGRLEIKGNRLRYVRYFDDFQVTPLSDVWMDTSIGGFVSEDKVYVVQTSTKVVQRCLLMTTDPGGLVMDVTCGSGTTAFVAEQWGRRWITCDTSRVALTLAKQRLMTGVFDYYELAHPDEGVGSGFKYKTVPHVTLKSIANNEPAAPETLYDQPLIDNSKTRVTGPFTVEAVPAPMVKSIDEIGEGEKPVEKADESIARSGETLRQSEWRDELMRAGIRGKNGQMILFSRVEPFPGTRWLHADAETKPNELGAPHVREEGSPARAPESAREARALPERVAISFGPEYAPLEQKQVELAIEEARSLVPKPKIIVFAAFQFDPEAAKDIDETNWPGMTLLKAQMNADLLTEDLKKKRASNESFWLIGQPDVQAKKIDKGDDAGRYRVSVGGFDYYNTKTGQIESGSAEKIAMWML